MAIACGTPVSRSRASSWAAPGSGRRVCANVGIHPAIAGFRAPRLEVNDNGLNALKAIGYQYDENLEEILPDGFTDAAIAVDTPGKKGFNWIPWPYTLDNGSPGIWNQQVTGDKKWVTNYPTGIWEVPVLPA